MTLREFGRLTVRAARLAVHRFFRPLPLAWRSLKALTATEPEDCPPLARVASLERPTVVGVAVGHAEPVSKAIDTVHCHISLPSDWADLTILTQEEAAARLRVLKAQIETLLRELMNTSAAARVAIVGESSLNQTIDEVLRSLGEFRAVLGGPNHAPTGSQQPDGPAPVG